MTHPTRLARALALVTLSSWCVHAQPSPSNLLVNPSFESGELGKPPPGWDVGKGVAALDGAKLTDVSPANGSGCLSLEVPAGKIGGVAQILTGDTLRGKRIRFRMAIRTDDDYSSGEVRLAVEVEREPPAARIVVDAMSDRPVRGKEWTFHEIIGDIDAAATRVLVICRLSARTSGPGQAWLDDATLEVLGNAPPKPNPEGPRPLTAQGLVNVAAFARMLGYVRYFHPGDEMAATPWEPFTIEGLRAIESAASTDELGRRLNELFAPIAPLVRVARSRPSASPDAAPAGAKTITVWRHIGFGTGGNTESYSSRRAAEAIPAPDSPRARELRPFVAEFSPGLWIFLPLAVYSDDTGTLPRVAARPKPSMPEPTRSAATARDRATRLAAVVTAWNVLQHSYPYFDVVKTDWLAELNNSLRRAATDTDERAFLGTLRRFIATLHDGHGGVEFSVDERSRPGIRAELIENEFVVTDVITAAAREAGLAAGDLITRIDGRRTDEVLAEVEAEICAASRQDLLDSAGKHMLRGAHGSEITIEFESFAQPGVRRTAKLTRELPGIARRRTATLAEIEPGIFYIDLDRVTSPEFVAALPKLERARGQIFDLRGYPNIDEHDLFGYLSRTPIDMQPCFKLHIVRPDQTGINFVQQPAWNLPPKEPYLAAKRAFITNGSAVSYAESCMGIVEHYKLAAIVGGPTAGTNGSRNWMGLPGGYTFSWTGLKVVNFDGSQFHGIGIQPTIPCAPTRAGIAAGRDELLEQAIAAVKEP